MTGWLQFGLDLFERATGAPAASADAGQPLAPVRFAHPRASREVLLDGAQVAYALRRARRRSIGFTVGPDGLEVSAPTGVSQAQVDAALRQKGGWILRKLGEARERQRQQAVARIDWRDGATLPFLGEPLQVVLDPSRPGAGVLERAAAGPDAPRLHLGLHRQAGPEQIRDAAQAWLMREARRIFVERLDYFAPQLGVQWKKLGLSSAATRWGSARSDGSIRLNWRLVHFRLPVLDYVVVHELSHLRVMDHSPRFWDTVRSVAPDYEVLRGQLKKQVLPPW